MEALLGKALINGPFSIAKYHPGKYVGYDLQGDLSLLAGYLYMVFVWAVWTLSGVEHLINIDHFGRVIETNCPNQPLVVFNTF